MILQELRDATRPQHEALESRLNILAVNEFEKYADLVERFYAFYAPLEMEVSANIDDEFEFPRRRKIYWLEKDLAALGRKFPDFYGDLPLVRSRASALGCLYVMEGATLGGQVISRHFRECLGLNAESGLAFYEGYGRETGSRWASFRLHAARLGDEVYSPAEREEVIVAAQDTFTKLGDCLALGPLTVCALEARRDAEF